MVTLHVTTQVLDKLDAPHKTAYVRDRADTLPLFLSQTSSPSNSSPPIHSRNTSSSSLCLQASEKVEEKLSIGAKPPLQRREEFVSSLL